MHPCSPCQGFHGSNLLISYQRLSLPIRLRREEIFRSSFVSSPYLAKDRTTVVPRGAGAFILVPTIRKGVFRPAERTWARR